MHPQIKLKCLRMNMYIWGTATVNQLFVRGSYTQIKFSKKCSQYQKSILCDRSILYSPLAFDRTVLYGNVALSIVAHLFLRKALVFQFFRKLVSNSRY